MKTKISIIFLTLFFAIITVKAQEFKQEEDLLASIIGKAKKDFVVDILDIPEANSQEFWTYYNQYETDRQNISKERFNLLSRYVDLFDSNDPRQYKDLTKDVLTLHKQFESNLKKYYKLINKKVGPKTAMQFFQVEEYLRSTLDSKIYENLRINR